MDNKVLLKMSLEELLSLKDKYDDLYYNDQGDNQISDAHYDYLVELIKKKDPKVRLGVGCKLRDTDNKVTLPYFLGSMDKIKYEEPEKLNDWVEKQKSRHYIISNKLNGVSCLIIFTKKDNEIKLYTRGDGYEGSDISYLSDKIQNIPQNLSMDLAVRGEIIIPQALFEEKYLSTFKTSLSLIVGSTNSKTLKEPVFDLQFIAYEVIGKNMPKPSESLSLLQQLGFKVVDYSLLTFSQITPENLKDYLEKSKANYEFDIDGLIIQKDTEYDRENRTPHGCPRYAVAFKMLQEVVETRVTNVEWNVSKWGCLKPRLCLEPRQLGGTTVSHATAFNAKFVFNSKIGKGAVVKITKSGEVIPKVLSVVTPAIEADMPSQKYAWNESGVDIFVEQSNTEACLPLLVHFFVSMGIKNINEGVVLKLINTGFDTIEKILKMSKEDFLKVPTFKDRMAERLYENIHSVVENDSVPMNRIMVASGIFGTGLGLKKAESLLRAIPDLETFSFEKICEVEGFSSKSAEKIMSHIEEFKTFLKKVFPNVGKKPEIKAVSNGKIFVFTKFRSAELEKFISDRGGVIGDSLTKKTFCLVVPDETVEATEKMKQASAKNILVVKKSDVYKLNF